MTALIKINRKKFYNGEKKASIILRSSRPIGPLLDTLLNKLSLGSTSKRYPKKEAHHVSSSRTPIAAYDNPKKAPNGAQKVPFGTSFDRGRQNTPHRYGKSNKSA